MCLAFQADQDPTLPAQLADPVIPGMEGVPARIGTRVLLEICPSGFFGTCQANTLLALPFARIGERPPQSGHDQEEQQPPEERVKGKPGTHLSAFAQEVCGESVVVAVLIIPILLVIHVRFMRSVYDFYAERP